MTLLFVEKDDLTAQELKAWVDGTGPLTDRVNDILIRHALTFGAMVVSIATQGPHVRNQ